MKKLQFDITTEKKEIEINGKVFQILKSDADILEKAADLTDSFENMKDKNVKEIASAIKSAIMFTDEILGDGAVKEITNNQPVGLVKMLQIMNGVCQAVVEEYGLGLNAKYE